MKVDGRGATDPGRKRKNNEDAFLVDNELGLYAVSDGMGGHAAGEVASRKVIEAIRLHFDGEQEALDRFHAGDMNETEVVALVDAAVQRACRTVYHLATQSPRYAGMGATVTMLLVGAGKAAMAHVGDTRLYLSRGGTVHLLSTDHKLGAEMIKAGVMTAEDVAHSPYGNALTRSVGNQEAVKSDTVVLDVVPGDRFVLCSDGLSDYLPDAQDLGPYIAGTQASTPQSLIAFANASGGHDNTTVVIVEVDEVDEEGVGTDTRTRVKTLRDCPLFEGLGMRTLAQILQIAQVVETKEGQVLARTDEEITSLVLSHEGRLRFERSDIPGLSRETIKLFGERAIMAHRRSKGDLIVAEAGRVLTINLEELRALMQHRPRIGLALLERFVRRLVKQVDALERGQA